MCEPRLLTRNNNQTCQLNESRMIGRQKKVTLPKGIVGVISDTHGLIRPEALAALKGVELIIHGGASYEARF